MNCISEAIPNNETTYMPDWNAPGVHTLYTLTELINQ